ncbi:MAG: hypothetical protein KGL39_52580 [Patescibacteria group bacterium]|nr:hypothetical protein [Patescibacteria group bacterium]
MIRGWLRRNKDGSHTLVAPARGQEPARKETREPLPDPHPDVVPDDQLGPGLTTDRDCECLNEHKENGQQKCYLVLTAEERAKGFVRPLRRSYTHLQCGGSTRMGSALCETYARDPSFYGGTFCARCGKHFQLKTYAVWQGVTTKIKQMPDRTEGYGYAFVWDEDGEGVGS